MIVYNTKVNLLCIENISVPTISHDLPGIHGGVNSPSDTFAEIQDMLNSL